MTGFNVGKRQGRPLSERLARMSRIDEATGCRLWQASLTPSGYGQINAGLGQTKVAHRVAWEIERGPIPDGLVLDHVCRNRACINPAHLRVVTHRENILCGVGATATHAAKERCPRGHEYDMRTKSGRRGCRICVNEQMKIYHRRVRGSPLYWENADVLR